MNVPERKMNVVREPITRKIVEDHGGRIYAADGEGLGAVIVVELPVPTMPQVPTTVHAASSAV